MTESQQHTTAFTLERRERFLALLTVGRTVEEAAAVVGISRTTIARWCARGRVAGARIEFARFAQRFDAARVEAEDVARRSEAKTDRVEDPSRHPFRSQIYGWALDGDPFVSGSPDELAELSPEQRTHVRRLAAERRANEPGASPPH